MNTQLVYVFALTLALFERACAQYAVYDSGWRGTASQLQG